MSDSNEPTGVFAPEFLRRGEDLGNLMLYMLKGALPKQMRDIFGIAAAQYVSNHVSKHLRGPESYRLDETATEIVAHLRQHGFAVIDPIFTAAELAEVKDYLKDKRVSVRDMGYDERGYQGEMLADEMPPASRFGYYDVQELCRCPAVYRAVHDQRLIHTMADYLRAPPTIATVSAWWSKPSTMPVGGMQMFHHDRGDFRTCNLFVYLTDVTATTGAHSFVERTHEMDVLLPYMAKRLGAGSERFNQFWHWMEKHRKEDNEIRAFFPEDEIKVFTGPPGTSFLEDTRGLHKGTHPTTGPRLAFEITYYTLPKYNEPVAPQRRADLKMPASLETDNAKIDPLVRYATRQMYI